MALFLNDVAFHFIKKLQITKLNLHIRKKLDPSNSNLYPNPVKKKSPFAQYKSALPTPLRHSHKHVGSPFTTSRFTSEAVDHVSFFNVIPVWSYGFEFANIPR